MNAVKRLKTLLYITILLSCFTIHLHAEGLLNRAISVTASHMPLQKVLELISRKGEFYFSYNSSIVNGDSVVSISASNTPVKQLLAQLLKNYQYTETGNYIIIKKGAVHPVLVSKKSIAPADTYVISGDIKDDRTGKKLSNASVYEKDRLVSTLTDDSGHFSIKLQGKYAKAALTISKQYYEDTTIIIQPKYNQQLTISLVQADTLPEVTTISPVPININTGDTVKVIPATESSNYTYTTKKIDSSYIKQRTRVGQFLLSASQKIQDLNIGHFIATKPYQVSLVPGIGTHGKLSMQVVNDVSLNIVGGYNAGVRGAELGLFFNLNKYDVRDFQLGGVFNITGGNQAGVQVAGATNIVRGSLTGVQVSLGYNHVEQSTTGIQASLICNYTHYNTKGLQVAGANISSQHVDGIQVGGFNYTKKLHGIQVGLINIAGSSDGYSIGLINFVMHGYHKVYASANEVFPINLAFKSGNEHLYSILLAGVQAKQDSKMYTFGYGLGTAIKLGRAISLTPELSIQYVYRGSWKYTNLLSKLTPLINLKLSNTFALTGGPVVNLYYSNQANNVAGYAGTVGYTGHHLFSFSNPRYSSWLGWTVGLTVF